MSLQIFDKVSWLRISSSNSEGSITKSFLNKQNIGDETRVMVPWREGPDRWVKDPNTAKNMPVYTENVSW